MPRRNALVLLAALLVAAAVVLALRRPPAPASLTAEAPLLVPIAPVGLLDALPAEIRWRPIEGVSRYGVEILDKNRGVIWKGSSRSGSVPFPREVTDRFEAREALYYRIRARGGLFRGDVAVSEPVLFRKSARAPS